MIPEMNKSAALGDLQYGEFQRFIGIWMLMSTCCGPSRRDYWKNSQIDMFDGAPFRLTEYMSRNRFEDILASLAFTNNIPPAYVDKFFHVRDIIDAWNENISENFVPGWVSCLDESMMVWTNKVTCPGFMFVPRKPHPFGNEWHSICCGISGIMFAI